MSECLMAQRGGKYTRGRTIYDYNLATTQHGNVEIWSLASSSTEEICTSVAVDNDNNAIYATYENRSDGIALQKLSSTDGAVIWSTNNNIGNTAYAAVVGSDKNIYVSYILNDLVTKLSSTDGTIIWSKSYERVSEITIDDDDNIYTVDGPVPPKFLRKLSGIDGTEIWSNNEVIIYRIAIDYKNKVIYGVSGTKLYKISTIDGTVIWSKDISDNSSIAVDNNGNIYLGSITNGVRKLSGIDGTEIWSNNYGNHDIIKIATDSAGSVYLANTNGPTCLQKVAGTDGTEIWSNKDYSNSKFIAVDDNNHIYVAYGDQHISLQKLVSTTIYKIK